jgi:HPt (histidine-containing phosphotransfer) domain-containing protein
MTGLIYEDQPRLPDAEMVAVLDADSLLDRCMGDAPVARELLTVFANRLPKILAEIEGRSQDSFESPDLARAVHNLKGNAGNMSAGRLYLVASALEEALCQRSKEDLVGQLPALREEAACFLRQVPSTISSLA